MSLRRFAGYFFALSVCSTIAFASCLMSNPPSQEAADPVATGPLVDIVPIYPKHHAPGLRRPAAAPKALLVARAD